MQTFYLRFSDEDAWLAATQAAGYWITEERPRPLPYSHDHHFDVIGPVTEGGEWDPETGEVITLPVLLEGFHVNARFADDTLPAGWDTYIVTPTQPSRVFAGD